MSQEDISRSVESFLYRECGLKLQPEERAKALFSSGRLDSMDIVKLIVFLDRDLGIKVQPFDISVETMDSVERIAAFVTKCKPDLA